MLQRHILVSPLYKNTKLSFITYGTHGLIIGACVGSVIALYRLTHTLCLNFILQILHQWSNYAWVIPLWFCILFIIAWIIGKLVAYAPHIAGSGVPEVELTLTGDLQLPWEKILISKFIGGWLAILGGLSLGQVGPSIQMGGLIGDGLSHYWLKQQSNFHIIGGIAAGVCAACGAPIAGVLLVFEQIKYPITIRSLIITIFSVTSAQLVLTYGFGIKRMFNFESFLSPILNEIPLLIATGIIIGIGGALYNNILLWFREKESKQKIIPNLFRAMPPLFCAGVLIFFLPEITEGGENLIRQLPNLSYSLYFLATLLLFKIIFSAYSTTGNIPGGILMPILSIGATSGLIIGNMFAQQEIIGYMQAKSYLIYGMVGFFAATVRAPLTSIILVTEITGALQCIPGTFLVGFLSHFTANLVQSTPIYTSLKKLAYLRLYNNRNI